MSNLAELDAPVKARGGAENAPAPTPLFVGEADQIIARRTERDGRQHTTAA